MAFHILNNMHHYVRMSGGVSQPHPVLSGVPFTIFDYDY